MKKLTLIAAITIFYFFLNFNATTQPCFPGGLYIGDQTTITYFNELYPNCTEIIGDLTIYDENSNIYSLDGLWQINSIGGQLHVESTQITDIAGLNLDWIGGDIRIFNNDNLTSLSGLHFDQFGGNSVLLWGNIQLTCLGSSFSCITELYSIDIECSPNLNDISSLINLNSLGYLFIGGTALTNFEGLNNLSTIGSSFYVGESMAGGNPNLIDFTGLENLYTIGHNISIYGNNSLINFAGLENLESIGGDFLIGFEYDGGNASLIDFTGLNNLSYIGGDLKILNNSSLISLTGLEGLNTIGGDLIIGSEINYGNSYLINLNGINNLNYISGSIFIGFNPMLSNIEGLENIYPSSISNLIIHDNNLLSQCDVMNICYYLITLNGTSTIYNNATGCNSQGEVELACLTDVDEFGNDDRFTISPNPLESTLLIKYNIQTESFITLKIFDLTGHEIKTLVDNIQQQGEQQIVINTAELPAGIYFCTLKTNKGIQTTKMIKT